LRAERPLKDGSVSGQKWGLFAGGGISHGGRVIGKTDDLAAKVVSPEWGKPRPTDPSELQTTLPSSWHTRRSTASRGLRG